MRINKDEIISGRVRKNERKWGKIRDGQVQYVSWRSKQANQCAVGGWVQGVHEQGVLGGGRV